MCTRPGGRVEQTGHRAVFLPCWMSFISRCRLDMRMPTACERFPSSSLTIWKHRKNQIQAFINLKIRYGFILRYTLASFIIVMSLPFSRNKHVITYLMMVRAY